MRGHKRKIFALARGFRGRAKNCWTLAQRAVHHAWQKAYKSRRLKKRDYRAEWIMRANAGARQFGLRYSELVRYLPAAGVECNRRILAELATTEPFSFRALVEVAKAQRDAEAAARAGGRDAGAEEGLSGGVAGVGVGGGRGAARVGSGQRAPAAPRAAAVEPELR